MDLSNQKCIPCNAGTPKLTSEEALEMMSQVPGWELLLDVGEGPICLQQKLKFKKFVQAIAFVNKVAELAEEQNHHPDIMINYNRVTLKLYTHAIKGLSHNDFIVAAKISEIGDAV